MFEVVDDAEAELIGTRSTKGEHNTPRANESEVSVVDVGEEPRIEGRGEGGWT